MFVLPNRSNEKKRSALKGRFGGIVYIRRPLEEGFGEDCKYEWRHLAGSLSLNPGFGVCV